MSTDTERELVDLLRANERLRAARGHDTFGNRHHPYTVALDTLEALIAEAHEARRTVHNLSLLDSSMGRAEPYEQTLRGCR